MSEHAVYVSSKLRHRDMWIASGIPTVSTWIDGEELPPEECSAMWDRYREEVACSHGFILYAEDEDQLKGCMIELGVAFATRRPIAIVWNGPLEALVRKIGTIVYHDSVAVVETLEMAREAIRNANT